jgi:uncharacterized protein (TIGR03083 family)
MEIAPRYDGPPVLQVEVDGSTVAAALVRQRTRFAAALAGLDEAQWAAPSRCEGWSMQDVVSHLTTTNQFWALSLTQGLAGTPSRFLVGFDPVATPALLVDGERSRPAAEVFEAFRSSCDDLAAVVATIEGDGWATVAEAPPGHVPATCVALHALWDAWVHERDVLLPLGLAVVEDPDEVTCCLRYAAGLGPGFRAAFGDTAAGTVGLATTDPSLQIVVEAGETVVVRDGTAPAGGPVVTGPSVDLLEALSRRGPFPAGAPPAALHLLGGLAAVFDQV